MTIPQRCSPLSCTASSSGLEAKTLAENAIRELRAIKRVFKKSPRFVFSGRIDPCLCSLPFGLTGAVEFRRDDFRRIRSNPFGVTAHAAVSDAARKTYRISQ